MKLTASKLLLGVVYVLAVFSIGVVFAHAETLIQVSPDVAADGSITWTGYPSGTFFGYKDYSGACETGTVIVSGSVNQNSALTFNGSYTMERGWNNGAHTTSDGSYCTEVTFNGSAYSPDYTGDVYYWNATRANGSWYGAVNWNEISLPLVYSTTSAAISASSSAWASLQLASSTAQCTSGNLFADGLCAGFSYLFLPNPNVLNGFSTLGSVEIPKHFPFSWMIQGATALDALSASTSVNFTATVLDMHSLGIGSTTAIGNILPSVTAISSSTITQFLPAGMWSTILNIMSAVAWLALFWYVWMRVRNRFSTT